MQSRRALEELGRATRFRVEELESLRQRFIHAAQENKKKRRASVVEIHLEVDKDTKLGTWVESALPGPRNHTNASCWQNKLSRCSMNCQLTRSKLC